MDLVINQILDELKEETGITKYELDRITESQFKCITGIIQSRIPKVCNLMYLGKIRPTKFFLYNIDIIQRKGKEHDKSKAEKYKAYSERMVQLPNG